jgi:hypothetical protein
VIWVTKEKVEIEMLDSDACTLEWFQAIQLSRWEDKRVKAEKNRVIRLPNTSQ